MSLFVKKVRRQIGFISLLLMIVILGAACGTSADEYVYTPTENSEVVSGAFEVVGTPTIAVAVSEVPTTGITVIAAVRADLSGTLWQLRSQDGQPVSAQITLQIVGNQISGLGGCNTYFATYEGIENSLLVDEVGRTEIFCEQTMEAENSYLAALESAISATRDNSTMTIQTLMGELVFKPVGVVAMENEMMATEEAAEVVPTQADVIVAEIVDGTAQAEETAAVAEVPTAEPVETDLISGSYLIEQVRQGDMVRRVVDGARPSEITFAAGNLSGHAGCNNFNATYMLNDNQLTISPIASTRMACTPALAAQEQMVFEALQTAQTVRIQGRDLIIEHASGTLLLRSTELLVEAQPPVVGEGTPTPEATTNPEATLPIVTGFDINILSAEAARIGVNGLFSDGCTSVSHSEQDVNGFIITFNVFVERDPTLTCIQQAIPFRESFDFEIVDLPPGDYTVIVNGAQGSFRLNDLGN